MRLTRYIFITALASHFIGCNKNNSESTNPANPTVDSNASPGQGDGFNKIEGIFKVQNFFSSTQGCDLPQSPLPYEDEFFEQANVNRKGWTPSNIVYYRCDKNQVCDTNTVVGYRGVIKSRKDSKWFGDLSRTAVFTDAPPLSGCFLGYGTIEATYDGQNLSIVRKHFHLKTDLPKAGCVISNDFDNLKPKMNCHAIDQLNATLFKKLP